MKSADTKSVEAKSAETESADAEPTDAEPAAVKMNNKWQISLQGLAYVKSFASPRTITTMTTIITDRWGKDT